MVLSCLKHRRVWAAPAVGALLVLWVTAASAAGSWTPISGTVYSNGDWYASTNVRTVRKHNNVIKVQFTNVPGGGIAFYVKNHDTGKKIGTTVYAPPTSAQKLGNAPAGTDFVNVFKEINAHKKPYGFDGSEYY